MIKMANETIKCPKCGYEIPVSEVLTHQIRETVQAELEKDYKAKESALIKDVQAKAIQKAAEKSKNEVDDLRNQVKEMAERAETATKSELEVRKTARALQQKTKDMEIEFNRKIDAEREGIRQEALKKADDEHRLKDMEKDKKIQGLMAALEDAKRKAEQSSMQIQGEVLEISLEEALKEAFPIDDIKPVPKGVKGADVIQGVMNKSLKPCGVILWESKHTKGWKDDWIQKLKDDQREMGAEVAVIVSETMPKGIEAFGLMAGVWVVRFDLVTCLATALRQSLLELDFVKLSSIGKNEKMEALYQYLSGVEFRQKIEAIVETFVMMKRQLDSEKRAMEKIWKERDKHIDRVAKNTVGMYGEVRAVIGGALPEIKTLELGPISETEEKDMPD
jgi:hypothetical protein